MTRRFKLLAGILLLAGGWMLGTHLVAQTSAPATATAPATTQATTMPRNDLAGLGNFAQVSAVLYRGEQPTAEGFAALKKMGVKTVVDLRALHSDRTLLKGTGLQYVGIPCNAWHPEEEDVVAFLKVLHDPANQPVFVHCAQGSDRTGMMVASYRMVDEKWNSIDAMAELPNFNFHPIWKDIAAYLKTFDAERVLKKAAEAKGPKIERID